MDPPKKYKQNLNGRYLRKFKQHKKYKYLLSAVSLIAIVEHFLAKKSNNSYWFTKYTYFQEEEKNNQDVQHVETVKKPKLSTMLRRKVSNHDPS